MQFGFVDLQHFENESEDIHDDKDANGEAAHTSTIESPHFKTN